jgi:proteasome accessory factor C
MDKFDRIQQLHRIFSNRRTPISLASLSEKMECSEKTVTRSFDTLRDYTQAPLEYDKTLNGWYYRQDGQDKFELPGLWLTAAEIQGLAVVMSISKGMDLGLFEDEIDVIHIAVDRLLESRQVDSELFESKVQFLPTTRQPSAAKTFQKITEALLNTRRLELHYCDYGGCKTQREISPLKLVQYQENWYLDAW